MQNSIEQLEKENRELKQRLARFEDSHKAVTFDMMAAEDDIELTSIIPLDELQQLQDKFSIATGVTSVIVDVAGKQITKLSNYSDICKFMLSSEQECFVEKRLVRGEHPVGIHHSCRLTEAKAPIFIGNRHIADWKIGMCGFGGTIAPFVKAACNSFDEFLDLFPKMHSDIQVHFENIRAMLETMANEISNIGFDKLKIASEITREHQNELKLLESQNTIQSIFDNSKDGIILIDADGLIKEWSTGFKYLNGVPREEAVGRKAWDVIGPLLISDRLEDLQTELHKTVQDRKSIVIHHLNRHVQTGEYKHLQATFFPVAIPESDKYMMAAIVRDVTDEEQAKEALRLNEERLLENITVLESIMTTLPAPLFVRNREGYYTMCNQAFLDTFGKTSEQVIGHTPAEIFPKSIDNINKANEQLRSGAESLQVEHTLHTVHGWHEFLTIRRVIHDKTGIVGIMMDISALKKIERELIRERDKVQAIDDNIPNGCLYQFAANYTTGEIKMQYISSSFEKLFNVPVADALGDLNNIFAMVHPDDLPTLHQNVQECIAGQTNFDLIVRLNSTPVRWVQVISHPHQEDGKTVWNGLFFDITQQKEIEEALKTEKNKLQTIGDNIPNGCLFSCAVTLSTNTLQMEYLGASFEELVGINMEDALADVNNLFKMVHPDDFLHFYEVVQTSIRTMSDVNTEFRFYHGYGGRLSWLQMIGHPRRESADKVVWDGLYLNITERKETDQKLQEEKNRLQTLGDNIPNGCLFRFSIHETTGEVRLLYVSAAWEKIFTIPAEDAMADIHTAFGMLHPDDLPLVRQTISNADTANDVNIEVRLKGKPVRWIQIRSRQHRENGLIIGDGILINITQRKETERALETENARFESLGNNLPNGCLFRIELPLEVMSRADASTVWANFMKFTYVSNSWEKLSNIPLEDVMKNASLPFMQILHEDLEQILPQMYTGIKDHTDFNGDFRYQYTTDEVRWLQISAHPTYEEEWIMIDGILLDVTDRKTAEKELEIYREDLERLVKERTEELEASTEELYAINEELSAINEEFSVTNEELHTKNDQLQQEMTMRKQIMQQLENSENMMRNFIAQSIVGIAIFDEKGKVIEWNPALERMTGLSCATVSGKYEWEIMFMVRTKKERTEKVRLELKHRCEENIFKGFTGEAHPPMEIDELIVTPEGEERYIHISLFTIELTDANLYGRVFLDYTEKHITDNELEQYRTMLEEMVDVKTQELSASQQRLVSLSDNLSGGVIFQMLNTQFTYISANFTNMFGIEVSAMLEDNTLLYDLIDKERHKLTMLYDVDVHTPMCDVECKFSHNHEDRWVHIQASCRTQSNGDRVWDGFMIDTTVRKIAEQELEEIRKRQSILIKILQIAQSSESMTDSINHALSEIGKYAGVSRTYIFEKRGNRVDNTYEWCNEGISSEMDQLKDLPISTAKKWFDQFDRGEIVCTSDIQTLEPEMSEIMKKQGIKSMLVLPLYLNGVVYGFVGFDDCDTHRVWEQSETELLISLSQIISNTTRRFRAENSILLSQQTMRTVLDNINANIYVADFESSQILFANKKIKEVAGECIEGEICWKVLQHQEGVCDFCPTKRLLDANKRPITGTYKWEHWNKHTKKWYECTDSAIEWVDGRVVHMEYATDITASKIAEEERLKSEELYRQLTVASPDAVIVSAPNGHSVYASPRAMELFQLDPSTELGLVDVFHYVHPHDVEKAKAAFNSFCTDNISYLPQVLLRRRDMTEFFGEISAASVRDAITGQITSIIMVIRDITERKQSEMELIAARDKAEESDKLKSAFLANMSHEIRTPINGIIGFLGFLNDDNLSPQRRQEYINIVNNSCQSLVKLIDDIIDTAKIEAKQMSIRPMPLALNDFMQELQVFFETYLVANGKDKIAMIFDDSQIIENCVTYVDTTRLRQVLSNLINNAVKFTEKGFVRFGYRQASPSTLEFMVEDSGIGLADDQLEVIFERFRQAELKNSRKYGGTGLGLTISRSLVQLMGGDIHVESTLGEGASFIFTISYLPVTAEDELLFKEEPVNSAVADNSVTAVAPVITAPTNSNLSVGNIVILIVEPEIMKRSYFKYLLSSTGAELLFAQTTQQWKEALSQQQHIDMALINADILKGLDMDEIRKIKATRAGLPLVLMLPERNKYYEQLITAVRIDKTIDLPVDAKTLSETLKNTL
ncbi:MAG: PAS domain S-box protein [Bacteroidales bacterium]|jgi:PAS domain S-box-containing protein|nr:PAS domain S-box protein [Bacteroidales bacterium]